MSLIYFTFNCPEIFATQKMKDFEKSNIYYKLNKSEQFFNKMVVIPKGSFLRGFSDEDIEWGVSHGSEKKVENYSSPQHFVKINYNFLISAYPVTVSQFSKFFKETGYNTGNDCFIFDKNWKIDTNTNWKNPPFKQTVNHPVTCINWNDTQAYIAWINKKFGLNGKYAYRLPSESEWEYAARAGSTSKFFWGEDEKLDQGCHYANGIDGKSKYWDNSTFNFNCDDKYKFTSPVGSYKKNKFGLYDMSGNVWEWVQDCWNYSYKNAPLTGNAWLQGYCKGRLLRGGSWDHNAHYLRSAFRGWDYLINRSINYGFRIARTLPKPTN